MGILILDDAVEARIKAVVEHATNPANYFQPGESASLPGDDPAFVVEAGTFKTVFSITRRPGSDELFRHLSVSLMPPRNAYPPPVIVFTLATLFGFTGGVSGSVPEATDRPGPGWSFDTNPASDDHPIPNAVVVQPYPVPEKIEDAPSGDFDDQ